MEATPPEPPDPTVGSVPVVLPPPSAPPSDGRIVLPPFDPPAPGPTNGPIAPELSDPAFRWQQDYPIRAARARRAVSLLEQDGTTWVKGHKPRFASGR